MPVIWICIGFAAGIVCADLFTWDIWAWWGLSLALICAISVQYKLVRSKIQGSFARIGGFLMAAGIAFSLGGVRYSLSIPDLKDPAFLPNFAGSGFPVEIQGLVVDFPDRRDQIQNLKVDVEWINLSEEDQPQPVSGFLLAKIPVEEGISYGDRVSLTGYLDLPPEDGEFNYRSYLEKKDIYAFLPKAEVVVLESNQGSFLLQVIYDLKENALERIYQLWPDPEASLLACILLGVESGISDPVQRHFEIQALPISSPFRVLISLSWQDCSRAYSAGY
jgi:predicted membrane metal-binding protein